MNPGRIGGSCLCGRIRFEVELPLLRANYCHCTRCRRHSGASGLLQARVPRDRFRLVEGASHLRNFREDGHAAKVFCALCGSSLFGGEWPDGAEVSIRMGAFDDDPGIRPMFHTFVADLPAWDDIRDNLPCFPGRARRADMQKLGIQTSPS